jgi:predicted nucleotidyltransferase
MNKHGLSQQTVERIQDELANHPEIRKAVLFGSRAKGTARPGSDIDLAL